MYNENDEKQRRILNAHIQPMQDVFRNMPVDKKGRITRPIAHFPAGTKASYVRDWLSDLIIQKALSVVPKDCTDD